MISFEHVSKFILSDINIHIPEGITLGLIGATGSGKTTFIKLCCGLLVPSNGDVFVMGQKPEKMARAYKKVIGTLLTGIQGLKPEATVVSNLQDLKLIYGLDETTYLDRYNRILEVLDIEKFQYENVGDLSLGQRRRVELLAVLIHEPKLLLLDEPSIGIDQTGKKAIRELIREREKAGLTTIITSHDMGDIIDVCSRICILDKGRICYYGNKELLFKRYAPVDIMYVKLQNRLPDLEDLPVISYSIDNGILKLIYNSNHITSAEILKVILTKAPIKEVSIHKPDLTDVIMKIEKGICDE